MEITYTKNKISKPIGKDSEQAVLSDLYTYFNHSSHLLDKDYGMYYYKFKARENHILEASYSDSHIKLVFCLSGKATNGFNSKSSFSFQENTSFLYQVKESSHLSKIFAEKEVEIMHIHIPVEVLEKYISDTDILKSILTGTKIVRPLTLYNRQITDQLKHALYNPSLQRLFIEKLIVDHLFGFLNDNSIWISGNNGVKVSKLEDAKYILDSSVDFITITELSKEIGVNEFTLKKEFKERFKSSIYQYQKDRKLQQAYSLINETTMKMEEIMEKCGYISLGSFSNSFYKKFKIRPSSLRNS